MLSPSVDQPEVLALALREELVALDILRDLLDRLAGILRHQLVHSVPDAQDFLGLDLDVGGHALGAARRLVNHDPRIVERDPHPRLAGAEQKGAHRGGLADAHRADPRADIFMVSWIAIPAVPTPPGALMYMKNIGRAHVC